MSLIRSNGPLAAAPERANYRIEGPTRKLFFERFPRRVRAVFHDAVILDTVRGKLLHESGLLPQLYVPTEDVRTDLLEPTRRTTRCRVKGDASYWSLRVGDAVEENAVWAYQEPIEDAAWLRGYMAFHWKSMDHWLDEDEEVEGHLRDPYHRVDVRRTSRRVRLVAGDEVLADTRRAKVLSETGLPNRYYIPPEDVRQELLQPSEKRTVCPYKGRASYQSVQIGDTSIPDAAWSYPEPLEDALKVGGYLCFLSKDVRVEIEGEPLA